MTTNQFVKRTTLLLCSVMLLDMSCTNNEAPEKVDCSQSDLTINFNSTNPSSCSSPNGIITVEASGGDAPYSFSINNGPLGDEATFNALAPGAYVITVRDKNGCERETTTNLGAGTIQLALTISKTGCETSTGAISVVATGGTGPYMYQLNNGTFVEDDEFIELPADSYTVTVKDATGCTTTSAPVKVLSNVSFATDIQPLLTQKCVGCHGPGGVRDDLQWNNYETIKAHASNIKTKTGNGSMPKGGPELPQSEKDMIACWVDDGALNN
ncbi:MAG TPA: c-type cytochrome [Ohtaekwangia sp.]|nr:c-type cytochrome [Ohtaekwangia sp.]